MVLKRACIWMLTALACGAALAEEDYISSAALQQVGLVKQWQLRLPLERDQALADLYLVDDQLYLTTNDGYVFAVHAATGANRWLRRVTGEGYRVWRPCHAGERVIFATPTTVLQLERGTGAGVHQMRLGFPCGTGPISDGSRFFLGGLDRRLYAFEVANPLRSWRVITGGPISSTPTVYGGSVFFASDDGSVYCCAAYDKAFRWQNYAFGSVTAPLVVDESGVYVASQDQSLYLFNRSYGETGWRARFSGPLYEAPVLTPGIAYQYCPDDGLVAVNAAILGLEEGRIRWKLPRGRMLLTVDERRAYVLSRDEAILVTDIKDGKVTHTLPAVGFTLGAAEVAQTVVYVGSPDGRLFCACPKGTPLVVRDDLRAALAGPEAGAEAPPEAETPGPAGKGEEAEPPEESPKGTPLGGKSKVSKNFGKGGAPAGSEP